MSGQKLGHLVIFRITASKAQVNDSRAIMVLLFFFKLPVSVKTLAEVLKVAI